MCILSEAGGATYGGKAEDPELLGEPTPQFISECHICPRGMADGQLDASTCSSARSLLPRYVMAYAYQVVDVVEGGCIAV